MVNTMIFSEKIQLLMERNQISASKFADILGVARSSISHIISGRNRPSLDFVMKILEAFPEVDFRWLLYDEGSFPKAISEIDTQKEQIATTESLNKNFSKNNINVLKSNNKPLEREDDLEKIKTKATTFKSKPVSDTAIERIVIFYVDGTFDVYKSK